MAQLFTHQSFSDFCSSLLGLPRFHDAANSLKMSIKYQLKDHYSSITGLNTDRGRWLCSWREDLSGFSRNPLDATNNAIGGGITEISIDRLMKADTESWRDNTPCRYSPRERRSVERWAADMVPSRQ